MRVIYLFDALAVIALAGLLAVNIGAAQDKPMETPKLEVGKKYLVKTWQGDKKECSNWVPVNFVSVSEHGDVGEFQILNTKEPISQWMNLDLLCDAQLLRRPADVEKGGKK